MIYRATIISAGLRVRETRTVAKLLLDGVEGQDWKAAILDRNILGAKSPTTATRLANLLRTRIKPLGEGLWTMIRDGNREQATQAAFAGAVKHSRLLGDFLDLTVRDQRALFTKRLENRMWTEYIEGCRGRDPEMPTWAEETIARLRSSVFSMLAEAGYLKDTKSLLLQNVFLDAQLSAYLRARGENYVLRCLEVAE